MAELVVSLGSSGHWWRSVVSVCKAWEEVNRLRAVFILSLVFGVVARGSAPFPSAVVGLRILRPWRVLQVVLGRRVRGALIGAGPGGLVVSFSRSPLLGLVNQCS